ncbi:MAG TPA: Trk system potassium transporter TrkA [Capillibacterium sp.]
MRIVVVGLGRVGYNISKALSEEGHDVIVIDKDPEVLKVAAANLDVMTVAGNGASARILEAVDIKNVDILLAVTENDELNMIACMTAKQSGVPMTVARIRNPDYTSYHPYILSYSHYGIDRLINPEHLAAQEIFRLIAVPMANDVEYFYEGKLSLVGLKITKEMEIAGQRIADLNLERFTIVSIAREGKALIPRGETRLLPEDKILLLGETLGFQHLNGLTKKKTPVFQRVVIAGGGLITQYFIRLLLQKKKSPEIVVLDPDPDLCATLATELPGCQIICANPTQKETLEELDLGRDDVFVSLLGAESNNLMASLLARQLGVEEVICEIGREDYIPLADTVGVTATITPRLLTVNTVLKLVRKSNIVSVNLLQSGDAEILEVIPEPGSPVTKAKLRDLGLPPGILIGALIHEGEVIVPRGETQIHPADHVVVFALKKLVPEVEKLFYHA